MTEASSTYCTCLPQTQNVVLKTFLETNSTHACSHFLHLRFPGTWLRGFENTTRPGTKRHQSRLAKIAPCKSLPMFTTHRTRDRALYIYICFIALHTRPYVTIFRRVTGLTTPPPASPPPSSSPPVFLCFDFSLGYGRRADRKRTQQISTTAAEACPLTISKTFTLQTGAKETISYHGTSFTTHTHTHTHLSDKGNGAASPPCSRGTSHSVNVILAMARNLHIHHQIDLLRYAPIPATTPGQGR